MRLLVAAFFLVAFLDALSTYVAVATGRGAEANPAVADVINNNPAAVFPLALISASPLAVSTVIVNKLAGRLPATLHVRVMRAASLAYAAAVLVRAAVAVNNLALISA